MLTIVCVQVQNYCKRGREYVRNLHAAVERNLTIKHRFVCYTDDPFKLAGVEFHDISGTGIPGWWNKLKVFQHETVGTVLYLDLDTFVVGPLDVVVRLDTAFAALRDFYRNWGLGSGVVLYNGDHSDIYRDWKKVGKPRLPGGDQEWLEHVRPSADRLQDRLPAGTIISLKEAIVVLNSVTERHLQSVPRGTSIICCHGEPKPHQLNGWTSAYWNEQQPARTHEADTAART